MQRYTRHAHRHDDGSASKTTFFLWSWETAGAVLCWQPARREYVISRPHVWVLRIRRTTVVEYQSSQVSFFLPKRSSLTLFAAEQAQPSQLVAHLLKLFPHLLKLFPHNLRRRRLRFCHASMNLRMQTCSHIRMRVPIPETSSVGGRSTSCHSRLASCCSVVLSESICNRACERWCVRALVRVSEWASECACVGCMRACARRLALSALLCPRPLQSNPPPTTIHACARTHTQHACTVGTAHMHGHTYTDARTHARHTRTHARRPVRAS